MLKVGLPAPVKRFTQSTCLLVVTYLCLLPFVFAYVRPLAHLDTSKTVPVYQRLYVSKVSDFMTAPTKPDVLMLGSSLLLSPAVRCDDELEGQPAGYDSAYNRHMAVYSKAKYFEQLWAKSTGHKSRVTNLGVFAAMASDVYLIVKKALSSGKRPNLILYGIAPRDFMCNELALVTKTSPFLLLGDLSCLEDLIKNQSSLSEISEFALQNSWHFYAERGDYQALLVDWAASVSGHPRTLADAIQPCIMDPAKYARGDKANDPHPQQPGKPGQNMVDDLVRYRLHYNPANLPMMDTQTGYFEELLQICKQSQIPLVVINMPLTQQNKSLLPAGILDRYHASIQKLTGKYGTKFVDLDAANIYDPSDFDDSCHLNAKGGRKFYAQLIKALLADPSTVRPAKSAPSKLTNSGV